MDSQNMSMLFYLALLVLSLTHSLTHSLFFSVWMGLPPVV